MSNATPSGNYWPSSLENSATQKVWSWTIDDIRQTKSDVLVGPSGRKIRRQRWPVLTQITGTTTYLNETQRQTLKHFFDVTCIGQLNNFYFFYPDPLSQFMGMNVATGDGSSVSWIAPMKTGTWTALYENSSGTAVSRPFTVTPGAGSGGEDQVAFAHLPGALTEGSATSGGSLSAGAYKSFVTFVISGLETLGGTLSNSITATSSQKIPITGIPIGPAGTTARKVYRTKAGGSTYFLELTISDNTTTTGTLTAADGSLGAQAWQAPTVGAAITGDVTGYKRYLMTFGTDTLDFKVVQNVAQTMYQVSATLDEEY